MSVREIKIQLDTAQLDDRYAQYNWVSCLEDEVHQAYYCKAEVDEKLCQLNDKIVTGQPEYSTNELDDKFYEMERANLDNTADIAYLQSELQLCKAELVVIQSKLATLIAKSTEENPFYSIFESIYKK